MRLAVPLLLALVLALPAARAWAADPVEGDWWNDDGEAHVRLGPCPDAPEKLCGRVIGLKTLKADNGGPVVDENNPDPKLRTRPVMGLQILSGYRKEAPGRWVDGRAYDPEDGKSYRSNLEIRPDGKLKVEGCLARFVCGSKTWTR
jgi:uncharacterized protein (DUF2147 family)